jgi:predicted phage tail protein
MNKYLIENKIKNIINLKIYRDGGSVSGTLVTDENSRINFFFNYQIGSKNYGKLFWGDIENKSEATCISLWNRSILKLLSCMSKYIRDNLSRKEIALIKKTKKIPDVKKKREALLLLKAIKKSKYPQKYFY